MLTVLLSNGSTVQEENLHNITKELSIAALCGCFTEKDKPIILEGFDGYGFCKEGILVVNGLGSEETCVAMYLLGWEAISGLVVCIRLTAHGIKVTRHSRETVEKMVKIRDNPVR